MENQFTGMENHILESLEKIHDLTNRTIFSIKSKRPCENVFDQFAKIKSMVKYIESLLLENQLKECFLTDFPQLKELFATIQDLRMKGFGALIVIEREDSIEKIVTKNDLGVLLDAKISGKLLENIFYPGTPLHDRAVIIFHH